MTFENQEILADLTGVWLRLDRVISKFNNVANSEQSAADRLRVMSGKVDSLIRVWAMTDEQVGEEFQIASLSNPRERILNLIIKELARELNGDWGRHLQEIRNEQEKKSEPEWIIEG